MARQLLTIQVVHAVDATHDWHQMPVNSSEKSAVGRLIQFNSLTMQLTKSLHRLVGIVGVFFESWIDLCAFLNIHGRGRTDGNPISRDLRHCVVK